MLQGPGRRTTAASGQARRCRPRHPNPTKIRQFLAVFGLIIKPRAESPFLHGI